MYNIFIIDEILVILCNYLETKESLTLSACNRYLYNFVMSQHKIKKIIYKWDIPITTSEQFYHSLHNFYIITNNTARFINGHNWHIQNKTNVDYSYLMDLSGEYIPTETGILTKNNSFVHIELEPMLNIDNWHIKSSKSSNFAYNGKLLIDIEHDAISLYKDGDCKSIEMIPYGWIFQYDNRYIIKDRYYFYIINYDTDGLIERKIKNINMIDGYCFTIMNKDMICACTHDNNLYYTNIETNEMTWVKFTR